jgi:hypothetical protein
MRIKTIVIMIIIKKIPKISTLHNIQNKIKYNFIINIWRNHGDERTKLTGSLRYIK